MYVDTEKPYPGDTPQEVPVLFQEQKQLKNQPMDKTLPLRFEGY